MVAFADGVLARAGIHGGMVIRKLRGQRRWRLDSRKADPRTGRKRNPGTFDSRAAAERHEREIQSFKRR